MMAAGGVGSLEGFPRAVGNGEARCPWPGAVRGLRGHIRESVPELFLSGMVLRMGPDGRGFAASKSVVGPASTAGTGFLPVPDTRYLIPCA